MKTLLMRAVALSLCSAFLWIVTGCGTESNDQIPPVPAQSSAAATAGAAADAVGAGPAGRFQPTVPTDYPGMEKKAAGDVKQETAKPAESKKEEAKPAQTPAPAKSK